MMLHFILAVATLLPLDPAFAIRPAHPAVVQDPKWDEATDALQKNFYSVLMGAKLDQPDRLRDERERTLRTLARLNLLARDICKKDEAACEALLHDLFTSSFRRAMIEVSLRSDEQIERALAEVRFLADQAAKIEVLRSVTNQLHREWWRAEPLRGLFPWMARFEIETNHVARPVSACENVLRSNY